MHIEIAVVTLHVRTRRIGEQERIGCGCGSRTNGDHEIIVDIIGVEIFETQREIARAGFFSPARVSILVR